LIQTKTQENMNLPEGASGYDQSPYRVLFNYLLRSESGVSMNWWAQPNTRSIIDLFCKEMKYTDQITQVMKHVPDLISVFFDVLIAYAEEISLNEFLPIFLDRFDQLCPHPRFQTEVQKVMVEKLLAIFQKYPDFVFKHQAMLMLALTRNTESRRRMTIHLCWIIGEYATLQTCTGEILNDYDERLELMVFELMHTAGDMPPNEREVANEFMCVLISALSKLAARWPPLSSRVSLCLSKLERNRESFTETVHARAMECLNILKFPSIAAAVLGSGLSNREPNAHHVDNASSLPFQLVPTGLLRQDTGHLFERQVLHQFSL